MGIRCVAVAEEPPPLPEAAELSIDALRNDVLAALEEANQQMLAHNLESGEWSSAATKSP